MELAGLLDLSTLDNAQQIPERFCEIAKTLLHNYRLCVEHEETCTTFQLLEIEFYLFMEKVHEDPFCHSHTDQSRSAQW